MTTIDYFAPAPTEEERVLRRIKGNFRRRFVAASIAEEGLEAVPPAWLEPGVSEVLKGFLQAQHPQARGGEDLPDLDDSEVEIARLSLVNSVHGEVTSLRAQKADGGSGILLRMVDEYGTEFDLPRDQVEQALSAEEVVVLFRDADPSPMHTDCEVRLDSFFYPDLDDLAG